MQARRGGDGSVHAAGLLREDHRVELVRVRVRGEWCVVRGAWCVVRASGEGESQGQAKTKERAWSHRFLRTMNPRLPPLAAVGQWLSLRAWSGFGFGFGFGCLG